MKRAAAFRLCPPNALGQLRELLTEMGEMSGGLSPSVEIVILVTVCWKVNSAEEKKCIMLARHSGTELEPAKSLCQILAGQQQAARRPLSS